MESLRGVVRGSGSRVIVTLDPQNGAERGTSLGYLAPRTRQDCRNRCGRDQASCGRPKPLAGYTSIDVTCSLSWVSIWAGEYEAPSSDER